MDVRVRFAPSPTGYLHVGNIRTALFNWLFARHHGGVFVLRIEDTDAERSAPEYERAILEDLRWLGLDWEEGVERGGLHGPYRQTERFPLYRRFAEQLLREGKAYHCFCTPQQLEADRAEQMRRGAPLQYVGRCRDLSSAEVRRRLDAGEAAVIRFRVPQTTVAFEDLVLGRIAVESHTIGDFVLLRSDGTAPYNFACVVDDALMEISHVIRGEGHLSNTSRQLLLFEALEWEPPRFAHLSTILGPDGAKLSKRHGATSIREFRRQGFLPEALVNYLALLGWSPPDGGEELLTLEELVAAFDLDRVQVSPATFDLAKLRWVNRYHLRRRPTGELAPLALPFLRAAGLAPEDAPEPLAWHEDLVELLLPYCDCLQDLVDRASILDFPSSQEFAAPEVRSVAAAPESHTVWRAFLQVLEEEALEGITSAEAYRRVVLAVRDRTGIKGKTLFQALRVGLTGRIEGPELERLVPLLDQGARLSLPRRILSVRERFEQALRLAGEPTREELSKDSPSHG